MYIAVLSDQENNTMFGTCLKKYIQNDMNDFMAMKHLIFHN